MDARGKDVEEWQDENKLVLVNDPIDQDTFYSRCWHTTSTPDLAFCTEDVHRKLTRKVSDQLGGSDHRPVLLTIEGMLMNQNILDGTTKRQTGVSSSTEQMS